MSSYSAERKAQASHLGKSKVIDLIGQTFGRLTVVRRAGSCRSFARWECRCECGGIKFVTSAHLRRGNTKSCGCLQSERAAENCRTHGKSDTQEYSVWGSMITRCTNPKAKCYPSYGGRGITGCKRWLLFENFLENMGTRPPNMSLERKDVNQGYFKENCCWAPDEAQRNNKRTSVYLTHNGLTMTITQWIRRTGLKKSTVWRRLKRGLKAADIPATSRLLRRSQ